MKRTISLLLSLVIVLSMVCVAAPRVSAASAMKTSEQCVSVIKQFEGFAVEPYEDNGNWSVGYGTGVSGADLKKYQENGITEAEADALMRQYLARFEQSVNSFIDKHGLKLTQNQFDALISFTYNLGPSWMNNTSYTLTQAVINGATGNDFLFALVQWCKASGSVLKSLINRRLCEANMYLNNVYSNSVPVHYRYVIFDTGVEDVVSSVSVQGFDSTLSTNIRATASRSGYEFLGWYPAAEGGTSITMLNSKTTVNKLYARWQKAGGEYDEAGKLVGVPTEYVCYAATEAAAKVYDAPGGEQIATVKGIDKLEIVAEHLDSAGNKWGKTKDGRWVNVSAGIEFAPVVEDPSSRIDPITVTVTGANVNNRTGPGTNYAKQGTFTKGQTLTLTAVQKGGNYMWGKSEIGWICLDYTDYDLVIKQNSPDAGKVTAIGTIIKADVLNVRSGPGVHNEKVDSYNRGEVVEITLQQKVGNTVWGLTEKGWISLYYADLEDVPADTPSVDVPGSGSGDNTGTGDDTGNAGATGSGGNTGSGESSGDTVIATGTVYNCNSLRIRAGAGTNYAQVGSYVSGTQVNIYETVTVRSDVWGRTEKGWICLRYVNVDTTVTGKGVTGRIANCDAVNVRAGAGTNFAKVGKLAKGTKVEILEYTKVGNATWGRTEKGWIHLYYVQLDAPLETLDKVVEPDDNTGTGDNAGTGDNTGAGDNTGDGGNTDSGDTDIVIVFTGTITADPELKIRSVAGTSGAILGTYKKGERVTIHEIILVGKTTWGRTEKGWISLYYLKPDGTTSDERIVVKTANTTVQCYDYPSTTSKVLATYYRNNLIIVTAETVEVDGKIWALTPDGWILASKLS